MVIVLSMLALAAVVVVLLRHFTSGWSETLHHGASSFTLPPRPGETVIDQVVEGITQPCPGHSGLCLVSDDLEAFQLRRELAENAGRSLDLQYYSWKNDMTGRLLIREVLVAADRGVRVRLLLDDINSMGLDPTYLALNSHPNIQVRLFNPCRSRENAFRRGAELLLRYVSATRRMHNKCWIADGRVVLVGGRNIGNAYFGASEASNFRDVDILGIGEVVHEASHVFDQYWNSPAALPITTLHPLRHGRIAKLRYRLSQHSALYRAATYIERVQQACRASPLGAMNRLEWVTTATVIADPPEKASAAGKHNWIAERVFDICRSAKRELILCSPYFIPGEEGMELLLDVRGRGAEIAAFTNSLATTDVMIVHSAYARYRRRLLEFGVALYEQRPSIRRRRISLFGLRNASLHTKACVADRRRAFVGSYNLDPRSRSINTEMGIVFESDSLANELAALIGEEMSDGFRLSLRKDQVVWTGALETSRTSEPGASLSRKFFAWIAGFLPIESQL